MKCRESVLYLCVAGAPGSLGDNLGSSGRYIQGTAFHRDAESEFPRRGRAGHRNTIDAAICRIELIDASFIMNADAGWISNAL